MANKIATSVEINIARRGYMLHCCFALIYFLHQLLIVNLYISVTLGIFHPSSLFALLIASAILSELL